jgi:hypothetical protein
MDNDLKTSLWNVLTIVFFERLDSEWISRSKYSWFFRRMWNIHLKMPIDSMNDFYQHTYKQLRAWFFNWHWYEVYDFLEFFAQDGPEEYNDLFIELCNNALEREMSAYRLINGEIVEITDQNEINSITQ